MSARRRNGIVAALALGLLFFCAISSATISRFWFTNSANAITVSPLECELRANEGGKAYRQVALTITNNQGVEHVIRAINTSCSCIQIKPIQYMPLAAYETIEVSFKIHMPSVGRRREEVRVFFDDDEIPITATFRLEGLQRFPYLMPDSRDIQVTFHELKSAAQFQDVFINSVEKLNSPIWLDMLVCEHPDVDVTPVDVDSQVLDEQVVRQYHWRVGWIRIPKESEFVGRLFALPKSKGKRIYIGQVYGRRSDESVFSPPSVVLSDSNKRQTVIVEAGRNNHTWQLSGSNGIPDWLSVRWRLVGDSRLLELHLQSSPPDERGAIAEVLFTDESGRKASLRVRYSQR